MKNINKSIEYAMNGNPIGFKNAIVDSINSKIADAVQIRKMKIGSSLFKDSEDVAVASDEEEFQSSSEGNVDEDI